jgi:hypothetical protein
MAHFAELDENNVVTRVIVVATKDNSTADGVEKESIGQAFCERLFGGNWIQTSYNNNMRVRYAGIGYTYDATLDAFIPPKPYPSWTLDNATADWVAPVPMPNDGKMYSWDEVTQSWVLVEPQPVSPAQ